LNSQRFDQLSLGKAAQTVANKHDSLMNVNEVLQDERLN